MTKQLYKKKLSFIWKVPGSDAGFSMTWPFLFSFLSLTIHVGTKSRCVVTNTVTAEELAEEMQITLIYMTES